MQGRTPDNGSIDTGEPTAGDRIGPYEIDEFVARGGMATVLSAVDTRSEERCAIKLLLSLANDDQARGRFRREFRALSRLNHPNVLRVFEWGLLGSRPWYSMELVPGRDLRHEVELWSQLSPQDRHARTQGILTQVARALAYIHDRGLVHRDITPANVMVTPTGIVKLMDFGVVKDMGTDLTAVGSMVGTVAYISPEQIAGENVDARADLYSLGAVLYLMLTGRRPFIARTLQGFLEKHLNASPRPPVEVDPLVPPHLNEICLRLLAKDPADRYASAIHLLHVLGDDSGAANIDGRWPPHLVGRRVIRDKVQECLTQLQNDNKGNAIYLAGEPGQGKSRLLSLAEGYALRYGLKTVRSRCQPQDPPFGPFIPIYEALRSEPSSILEQALRSGGTGQIRERYPVIAAFRDVITQNSPCILIIDDIQHADSPTLELLEYLIRNTLQLANEQVVFILAEESALGGKSSSARRLCNAGPVTWFHLGPLSPPEVEELVLSILPNTPASLALAKRLHAESHGSPAFIADMLRGLVKEGLIAENNQRYTLTLDASEVTRSRLPMPVSLRAALKERLSPLSAAAMELGRTLALSRHQMDLDVLIAVAALDEDEVMEALDELVEANIVKESRTDDNEQVELNHKRFRDVFVEELDPEDLRSRHQLIGEVLELHSRHRLGDVAEQLTFHFEHAGLASKAYAYLTQTANRHLEASSFDRSLSILNRALHMEPTARSYLLLNHADQQLAQILIARARCLHHLGQWQNGWKDAQRAYQIANQTPDTRLQSQIATYLGHRLREQGDAQEAEKFLREALRKADEIGDVTLTPRPLYHLGAIMWSKGDLEQSNALWVQTLTTARASNDDWATGFGFNGLGILAICQGQSMDARRKLEQSAEIFERVGLLPPLAIARVNLAELYHSTGILKKAMAMAERTVAQATEVHHLQGIALGLAHRAQIIVDIGRLDEALDNAKEAHRIIKELNAKEDEQLALATMARVHMVREEPEEACAMLEELLPLLEHQDYEGIDPVMQAWHANVLAVLGRMDDAVAALERARAKEPLWPHIIVRRDLAVANAHMRLDQPELAQQTLQRALQRAESNGYRFFQLLAHNGLCKVSIEASARARHGRVASALARSLAANLPSNDSQSFLKRGWGQTDT